MKKIIAIILFLIGLTAVIYVLFFLNQGSKRNSAPEGIIFDSAYTNSGGDQYTNFSSWTHTVGSKPNRVLIVGVTLKSKDDKKPPEIIEITFSGKHLNEFKKILNEKDKSLVMQLYYLKDPKEGANNIIIKTKSQTAISAGSFVFRGVDQKLPPNVLFSSWQVPKMESISVEKGEVLFDYISAPSPDCISIPNQPQRLLWASYGGENGGILAGGASYKKMPIATDSASMSWRSDTCLEKNKNTDWFYFVGKLKPFNE